MKPVAHRGSLAAVVAAGAVLAAATPAAAHGVGGRSDLPVPVWLATYGAVGAMLASFAVLGAAWRTPRLATAAEAATSGRGRDGVPLLVVTRTIGMVFFLLTLSAAWFGSAESAETIAPLMIYVVVWVLVPILALVIGDVWRMLDPIDTLARIVERVRPASSEAGPGPTWTAPAMIGGFLWIELAYHDSASPRMLAATMTVYVLVALVGVARWGRGWLARGEGFAVLFGALGRIGPVALDERDRLHLTRPLSRLAATVPTATTLTLLVTLGGTAFDGLTRTTWWLDISGSRTGWDRTTVATIGLVGSIAVVMALYRAAAVGTARIGRRDVDEVARGFGPSLAPIALGYAIAHYASLLIFEGQELLARISDPLSRGWDVFGTATNSIDFTVVSTEVIAWIQVLAIVIGHVLGVLVAHDRSVEWWSGRRARDTQYPLMAVMVLFTMGGIGLLLGT
ncbi:MAG: hypothetical protein AAGA17_01320 [Actinomycetota bacterium]